MTNDMTQGSLAQALVKFCLPLIFSGLLQQLYNWADAFMVGNVDGELSLAAIGATIPISNLIIMMLTGFSLGISVLSGQLYGSGKQSQLAKVLSTFTITLSGLFLVATVCIILFTEPILLLLKTPNDIFLDAKNYLQIILLCIPCLVIYNVYSAVLRGMGDSKTSFLAIVISSVINILLDFLFIVILHYGIIGAAVATLIAQIFMAIFMVYYCIKKYSILRLPIKKYNIDRNLLAKGLSLSLPTAIQSSVHSVGNLMLQNFMNGFGTSTVAAITTAYRVDGVIMLPIINLGYGISTVVAQNIGAGHRQRAKRGVFIGIGIISAVSILLTAAVMPTGGVLVALFGVTQESATIGKTFFHIIAPFYFLFGLATAIRSFLEGVGDVLFTSVISIFALVVRIVLSYALASQYGNRIVALAEGLSWAVLLLLCFIRFLWKHRENTHIKS